jgi:hypothetical protein
MFQMRTGEDLTQGMTPLQTSLILALLAVFHEEVLLSALLYSSHRGNGMKKEDLIRALKHQVLSPNGCAPALKPLFLEVCQTATISDIRSKPFALRAVNDHLNDARDNVHKYNGDKCEERKQHSKWISQRTVNKIVRSPYDNENENKSDEGDNGDKNKKVDDDEGHEDDECDNYDEGDDNEEDEDDDDDEDDEGDDDDDGDEIICKCDSCEDMNIANANWFQWGPTDVWEKIIYDGICKSIGRL